MSQYAFSIKNQIGFPGHMVSAALLNSATANELSVLVIHFYKSRW